MGKMVNTAKLVYDTLFNLMSGLGTSKDKMTGTQYALTVFSVADLEAAYRGDWLTRKIINIPPEDSTRQWRAWQAEDDQIEAIETVERQLDVLNKTQWAMKLDRLYGGSALILGVEGGEGAGAATELKLENIRKDSLKFIHAVSRYELTTSPELNMDLTSPYFRRPQWYERQIPGAMPIRIHPSRVIPFVSNPLPNPEASPASEGWGDPLLQSIDDAIKQTGITIASMAALVQESKFDIIKIPRAVGEPQHARVCGSADHALQLRQRDQVDRQRQADGQ